MSEQMAYIGVAPCGCVRAATRIEDDAQEMGEWLAEMTGRGYTVERVTWAEAGDRMCADPPCPEHNPAPQQVEHSDKEQG